MKNAKVLIFPLLACFAMGICSCTGKDAPIAEDPDGYVDVLPENNDGNILQAFNWKYSDIKDNLSGIANSGFKAVQTSPVQQPKNGGPMWYSFYQPVSFSIGTNSPLGTKAELQELCEEAEKYDIAIICDIVFNHTANIADGVLEEDGTPQVYPEVETYEPYIYQHRNDLENPTFHHNKNATGSGAITQYYAYGDLPDLNTANEYVQERCLSLLKECIDVGVDGFRFDAAKHIETPQDSQYASNFWPNVLGVAQTYYRTKTGKDLIAYGEILNGVDGGRTDDMYTRYMKITDNTYISKIAAASVSGKADKALEAEYGKKTDPSNLVTWVESHDTYVDSKSHVSNRKTARQYAIITSRKDTVGMYLARPTENADVASIGDYFFEDELVAVANRFHNRFVGFDEAQSANQNVYINERFKDNQRSGAMLVSLSGACEIELKLSHLADGVYYDQLSGQSVTVRKGKAKVTFDERGVVVLTQSKHELRPVMNISQRNISFAESLKITLESENATEAYYKINGGSRVDFSGKKEVTLGDVTDIDNMIHVDIYASNSEFSLERHLHFRKVTLVPGKFNIVNLNPSYLTNYKLYYWAWGGGSNGIWLDDFTYHESGNILIDFSTKSYTAFLLAIFPKGHVISNVNEWDSGLVKQTGDISTTATFFDASNF